MVEIMDSIVYPHDPRWQREVQRVGLRSIPSIRNEYRGGREGSYGIEDLLLKDRIILIGKPIDDMVAYQTIMLLLYLEHEDSSQDISLYLNSPGGSVTAGLAIYDTMQYIKPDVSTVCVGMAMSMGSVLLAGGAKGKRFSLPNSTILIHQPLISGEIAGQASDIEIEAREIIRTRSELNELLAKHTGQSVERIAQDSDRDNYMTAHQAVEYGLIDEVLEN
ncbi:ATP-dependent Clp protease proteolytic subunit [Ktedonobacter sp. SOSP1-85]|uniref:ATP-dependent Clp protease proteolytic subunit n=2 Tax=Ktedonobacter robiniae TaxID=2778365 RepID=A0ABQ3UND5_9CHLR|nr:ATP-dependent Clp protease proteolytic subunit [Ktedonobacter sp. SOSP1-85]GHO54195.1 ATP-dependent Clp protease proteolytic subunit [Ktedonobacter robiniae]GHO74237.1 ATP-dependent Clp protease proteolytic subunit [Ktedonobacter sp. SOSP1-85]